MLGAGPILGSILGVQCLVQGYFDIWTGGTTNPVVCVQPSLPLITATPTALSTVS